MYEKDSFVVSSEARKAETSGTAVRWLGGDRLGGLRGFSGDTVEGATELTEAVRTVEGINMADIDAVDATDIVRGVGTVDLRGLFSVSCDVSGVA